MKIFYINKNTTKCLFDTQFKNYNCRLYSFTFLPYIRLFHGDSQLYFIYGSVFIMAVIAASQKAVDYRSKKEKMKAELEDYNFRKKYDEMLTEKSRSFTNADTKNIVEIN